MAKWEWFGDATNDGVTLERWRDAQPNYPAGNGHDSGWHTDCHELVLGRDQSGVLFACAVDHLFRYKFYPPDVMQATTDFGLQDRVLRAGDRLLQRIHVVRLFGHPVLDVLTLTVVSAVIDEPREKGYAYVTTTAHLELGEWTTRVAWRLDDTVALSIRAVSQPSPHLLPIYRPFARALQRRAHRRGMAVFAQAVRAAWHARQAAAA